LKTRRTRPAFARNGRGAGHHAVTDQDGAPAAGVGLAGRQEAPRRNACDNSARITRFSVKILDINLPATENNGAFAPYLRRFLGER